MEIVTVGPYKDIELSKLQFERLIEILNKFTEKTFDFREPKNKTNKRLADQQRIFEECPNHRLGMAQFIKSKNKKKWSKKNQNDIFDHFLIFRHNFYKNVHMDFFRSFLYFFSIVFSVKFGQFFDNFFIIIFGLKKTKYMVDKIKNLIYYRKIYQKSDFSPQGGVNRLNPKKRPKEETKKGNKRRKRRKNASN